MSDDFLNAPSSLSINKKTSNLVALINWHRPVNIQQIEKKKSFLYERMLEQYDGEKSKF